MSPLRERRDLDTGLFLPTPALLVSQYFLALALIGIITL